MAMGAVWRGCLLGLGAAAPLGPVNVEIARRTLRRGFFAGFSLGCGAVTIDVTYAVLTSLSLRPALSHPRLLQGLGLTGGLFLGYLGILCLRGAFGPTPDANMEPMPEPTRNAGNATGPGVSMRSSYLTGLLMTSLNPMTLLFWFLAVPGVVGQITTDPRHDLPWVCVGVFVATIGWVCLFAGTMSWIGRLGRGRWLRTADLLGGAMLLGFAGVAIWRVTRGFLS